jgi:hypothetical protein
MRRWSLAILLCAAASGCAAPMAKYWSDRRTSREIEKLASEGSFPTAAQVGIPSSSVDKQSD